MIIQILSLALFASCIQASSDRVTNITELLLTNAMKNAPHGIYYGEEDFKISKMDPFDRELYLMTPEEAALIDANSIEKILMKEIIPAEAIHQKLLSKAHNARAKILAAAGFLFIGTGLVTEMLSRCDFISDQRASQSTVASSFMCGPLLLTWSWFQIQGATDIARNFNDSVSQRLLNLQKLRLKKQQLTAAPRATDV